MHRDVCGRSGFVVICFTRVVLSVQHPACALETARGCEPWVLSCASLDPQPGSYSHSLWKGKHEPGLQVGLQGVPVPALNGQMQHCGPTEGDPANDGEGKSSQGLNFGQHTGLPDMSGAGGGQYMDVY